MSKSSWKDSNAGADLQCCPSSSHSQKLTKMNNKIYLPFISDVINLYIYISSFWAMFHFLSSIMLFQCRKIINRNILLMKLKNLLHLLCQSWLVRFLNMARWIFHHIKSIEGVNNEKAKDMLHSLHVHIPYLFLMFISPTEGIFYGGLPILY